jgi:hypothetical protein
MGCLRLLAEGRAWFDEDFDYEAAACYEFSIAGLRGRSITIEGGRD